MNDDSLNATRSSMDIVHFGLFCLGFFVQATALVLASIPFTIIGFLMMLAALTYFALR